MQREKNPRRTMSRWLIVLPLVAIGGGIVLVAVLWLRRGDRPERAVARQPAPPLAAEPASPPAAWKAVLAVPSGQASLPSGRQSGVPAGLGRSLDDLPTVVAALGPQWTKLPPDSSAPAELLVLPGGARASESVSRIPRHERWEIQFPPGNTIDSYSRQLDFFKIELGVIGDKDQVTYLANLSAPTPTKRSEAAGKDDRLYLVWQRGALREAAAELASRAKVDPRGKVLAHFCPAALEATLAQLEEKFAAAKGHRQIRRTVFGIQPDDAGGYRFYVIDQQADQ